MGFISSTFQVLWGFMGFYESMSLSFMGFQVDGQGRIKLLILKSRFNCPQLISLL